MPVFISSAPTTSFNPLRQLSSLPGKKSVQDVFSPAEAPAGIYCKQDAWLKASATRPDLLRRVGLKEQVAEGAIPAKLEGRLADLLLRLKSLSPQQRGTLVLAMEDQLN